MARHLFHDTADESEIVNQHRSRAAKLPKCQRRRHEVGVDEAPGKPNTSRLIIGNRVMTSRAAGWSAKTIKNNAGYVHAGAKR